MSRRKLQWKRSVAKAGGLEKVIPQAATGAGEWLTKVEYELKNAPKPGQGRGNQCSLPMTTRKEQLVRQWTK